VAPSVKPVYTLTA